MVSNGASWRNLNVARSAKQITAASPSYIYLAAARRPARLDRPRQIRRRRPRRVAFEPAAERRGRLHHFVVERGQELLLLLLLLLILHISARKLPAPGSVISWPLVEPTYRPSSKFERRRAARQKGDARIRGARSGQPSSLASGLSEPVQAKAEPEPEARSLELEAGSWKLEAGSSKLEAEAEAEAEPFRAGCFRLASDEHAQSASQHQFSF